MKYFYFLFHFTIQEALSCIFPVIIFLSLAITQYFALPYRYDILLFICLSTQYILYRLGVETREEVKVIALFHLIGLALELFKVHMGSWAYPDTAWTKLAGVPIYSGFMYASVASYICQAWRRFQLQMNRWPASYLTIPLGVLIYLNFFTHHFLPDIRWLLTVLLALVFWPTQVLFTVCRQQYRMPLLLAFMLIGFFIWIAENIATYFGAWAYPDQLYSWRIVSFGKFSSWFLLVIISILIIAHLKLRYRPQSHPLIIQSAIHRSRQTL